ncbi:MAG: hypothetical protein BroJett011_14850 [Chloroflexota bacterium]|nr:MAG: hypothetical protein BroJett011_14850 [Chloroflexota bacterium]
MSSTRLAGLNLLLRNRLPLAGGWLRRWAIQRLDRERSPEAAGLLGTFVTHSSDRRAQELALTVLNGLSQPASIDRVCQIWAATRHSKLAELLVKRGWVATKPATLMVLTALHSGQTDRLASGRAEVVEPLVQAAEDADPRLAGRAKQILQQLRHEATQEALCRLVLEQERPAAVEAALAAGYVPREQSQRALFFFLTEQWAHYDSLDFDRRLLRVVYQSAAPALRQRLLERMRRAGRIEFLPIITGSDYRARLAEMQAGEFDLLAQTLAANREWPELWSLVFELPFRWSQRLVKTLAEQQWQPPTREEQVLFERLTALTSPELSSDRAELGQLFPPALRQAEARVPGRINDLAFASRRPVIAIGTGQRKVVLWNFQRADREHLLNQFDHSIVSVAFNPKDVLFCAERTTGGGACAIYCWDESGLARLGQHTDSVTALGVVDEAHLLSAGRDHQVILWDVAAGKEVRQQQFAFWARALRVAPSGQEAVLLHEGLDLVKLPELRLMERGPGGASVARCTAFLPDGQTLWVGQFNGEIVVLKRTHSGPFRRRRDSVLRGPGRVVGLEVLAKQGVMICARSEGQIEFRGLNDQALLGQVQAASDPMTSLHISADEAFMAVGSAQATLSLWDLRVLELAGLLAQPFGQATPAQLTTLNALSRHPELTPPAQRALQFAACVLQHRLRYAIELDETPQIKVGEFDIELE